MAGLELHSVLIKWIRENGGFFHENVRVAQNVEQGFHVQVCPGKQLSSQTRIASCPMSATLSILNVMDVVPFRSHGTNFPGSFIRKQPSATSQYFFLMEQYLLGQNSWWAPYISTLPTPHSIQSLHFSDDVDLKWLEGTNLKAALAEQTGKWRDMYEGAVAHLKSLGWPSAVNNLYTWELFLWTATMFGSRSFTSQVLSDTLPADQARPMGHDHHQHEELTKLFSEGFPVLLPLLDILNYKPGARVEWQARYSYVGLQILEKFEGGQEVYNNYGPRDNETLMVGYGFAISSNPFDHFSVRLRVPPGSSLADTRSWNAEKKSEEEYRCYIFNVDHPRSTSASCLEASVFSLDLLDSISVLSANDRELQSMYQSRRTYISSGLSSRKFEDNRNLLQTFAQLHQECQARLTMLRMTDPSKPLPSAGMVIIEPRNQKQRYAKIYRDSQIAILTTAVEVCRFVLLRSRTGKSTDEIILLIDVSSSSTDADKEAVQNLRKLIARHSYLVSSCELSGFEDLLSLLSGELKPQVQYVCDVAEKSLQSRPEISPTARATLSGKARLVVALAALRAAGSRGLPQYISKWIKCLASWYPPDDPTWNTILAGDEHDAVKALLEGLWATTRNGEASSPAWEMHEVPTWCDGERLCWAWNVVGEESVLFPPGILDTANAGGQGGGGGVGTEAQLLLYCPRD